MYLPKKIILEIATRCYRWEISRKIIAPFFKTREPEKWIFLLGCYNSGTTITQSLLQMHPRIACLPREGVRFTKIFPQPEDLGWTRMWIKCKEYMDIGSSKDSEKYKTIIGDWSPWWKNECDIFLVKSITDLTRVDWIKSNFENAYFIGITRDGYCVAEGIKRKARPKKSAISEYGADEYTIEDCAKQWVDANRRLLDAERQQDRFLRFKYEELMENPIKVLTAVFKFVEIEVPHMKFEENSLSMNSKEKRIRNMNTVSAKRLNADQRCRILKEIGDMQKQLDYAD